MKKKYKNLIKKYKLVDQTAFIEELLQNDRHLKYMNSLVNVGWYKAKISTGTFKGTEVHYNKMLSALAKKARLTNSIKQQTVIADDITIIEDSYKGQRKVKQWLAVPYWISKRLIENGEVVLDIDGACWWGI